MPIGVQAEGSARTWMGRNRRKTGRKPLRVTARDYRDMLHGPCAGESRRSAALTTALCEMDPRLGWTRERRARIVLRMDGGLARRTCATGSSAAGIRSWPQSATARVREVAPGHPGHGTHSSPGREMAAVRRPHRCCRTTRPWGMRSPGWLPVCSRADDLTTAHRRLVPMRMTAGR